MVAMSVSVVSMSVPVRFVPIFLMAMVVVAMVVIFLVVVVVSVRHACESVRQGYTSRDCTNSSAFSEFL